MSLMPHASWQAWGVGAALVIIVLGVGGALTRIGPWYWNLAKPAWQPPDWLFGPAWTLIGALMVFAAVSAWQAPGANHLTLAVLLAINAALNIGWSWLFFTRRRPDWALGEVAVLWTSCLTLVLAFLPVSRVAALAAVPYLAWVSFASLLNWAIVRLNPLRLPA